MSAVEYRVYGLTVLVGIELRNILRASRER
jgi:hypothetical protein